MIISTLVTAFSVACYALSNDISSLIALRMLHGIAFSFMGVANMAFASAFIPNDKLGEGLGYLALSNILAQGGGVPAWDCGWSRVTATTCASSYPP